MYRGEEVPACVWMTMHPANDSEAEKSFSVGLPRNRQWVNQNIYGVGIILSGDILERIAALDGMSFIPTKIFSFPIVPIRVYG